MRRILVWALVFMVVVIGGDRLASLLEPLSAQSPLTIQRGGLFSGTLTLVNGETISNATDGTFTFTANNGQAEVLSVDLSGTANTIVASSSTGVTTFQFSGIGLELSAAAPVVTWSDTTAGEDDFSLTADADVATFASGATNIFQAFGATHASAGDIYFINDVALDSDAGVLNFGASQDNAIGRADASSLYVSKGLHVGGTGAVADNNLLVDGTLVVSGAGPHAIGGATLGYLQLYQSGTFTASAGGSAAAYWLGTTINAVVNTDAYGLVVSPTFVEAASGTHELFAGTYFNIPVITAGDATATNATTAYIAGAPSATVTGQNLAMWSVSGVNRFGGLMQNDAQNYTIADDAAGTKPAQTVTPTSSYVTVTCNDATGCTMTMDETGMVAGMVVTLRSAGTGNAEFADSAGVLELAGGAALVAGANDVLRLLYTGAAWVELSRADN